MKNFFKKLFGKKEEGSVKVVKATLTQEQGQKMLKALEEIAGVKIGDSKQENIFSVGKHKTPKPRTIKKDKDGNIVSKQFSIMIDEDREQLLNGMVNVAIQNPVFIASLAGGDNMKETFESFMDEFAEKVHTLDMCRDPECGYESWKNRKK